MVIAEMQDRAGFPRSTWSGYEKGTSFPSFKDLAKISDYFGILESDLMRGEIAESDLLALYNAYILRQPHPENIATTPRAKSFFDYFMGIKESIPLLQKAQSVTESVTKRVTAPLKKDKKHYPSIPQFDMMLNEPGVPYGKTGPQSIEDRVTRLEAILQALQRVLTP